jgi:translation elongation factor EF-G
VPINASIAVLATDSALAQAVAQQICDYQRFSTLESLDPVSDMRAESSITFGTSITITAFAVEPESFDPPQLGSYLLWGADIALLVVDSSQGLDGESIQRAQELSQLHPLMVAVTGLDSPRANFDETLAVISRVMDQRHHAVAITLPVLSESGLSDEPEVGGILDLVDLEIRVLGSEGEAISHDLEQAHYDLIESHLEALSNAVVVTSTDESLIHSILEHGFESADQLRMQLLNATARRELIPVFAIADPIGLSELALFACEVNREPWTPIHPRKEQLLASAVGNGRVRVWQGELNAGTYFADNMEIEIIQINSLQGKQKATAHVGEIVNVKANQEIPAGSTISSEKSNPLAIGRVFE